MNITENAKLNYNSKIKENMSVVLSNRNNGTSFIGWGDSVVIGLYNTLDIDITTTPKPTVNFIGSDENFEIYDISENNLYVYMMSTSATPVSFIDVRRGVSATTIQINDNAVTPTISTRLLRKNDLYVSSDTLKVKIRNLSIPGSIEFDNLYLKYGIKNKYYIYGLSSEYYNSIDVNQLSNINFDIILADGSDDIILSNLKVIQKENNEVIFKIDTNINDFYVYVDTDMVEDEYAIYSDITFTANSFVNISNKETPILFDGQKTAYWETYITNNKINKDAIITTSIYSKSIENNIKLYEFDGTNENITTYNIPSSSSIQRTFDNVTYNISYELIGDYRTYYSIGDYIVVSGETVQILNIDDTKITTDTSFSGTLPAVVTIQNSYKERLHSIEYSYAYDVGDNIIIDKKLAFLLDIGDYITIDNKDYKIINWLTGATDIKLTLESTPPTLSTIFSIDFWLYSFKNLVYISTQNKYYAKLLNLSVLLNIFYFDTETLATSPSEFREIYIISEYGIESFGYMNMVNMVSNQKQLIYVVL